MVRETRHLWVGNLPETVREDRINNHFKRFGTLQNVKLVVDETPTATRTNKPAAAGPSREPQPSSPTTTRHKSAIVSYVDISSAVEAFRIVHRFDERIADVVFHNVVQPRQSPSARTKERRAKEAAKWAAKIAAEQAAAAVVAASTTRSSAATTNATPKFGTFVSPAAAAAAAVSVVVASTSQAAVVAADSPLTTSQKFARARNAFVSLEPAPRANVFNAAWRIPSKRKSMNDTSTASAKFKRSRKRKAATMHQRNDNHWRSNESNAVARSFQKQPPKTPGTPDTFRHLSTSTPTAASVPSTSQPRPNAAQVSPKATPKAQCSKPKESKSGKNRPVRSQPVERSIRNEVRKKRSSTTKSPHTPEEPHPSASTDQTAKESMPSTTPRSSKRAAQQKNRDLLSQVQRRLSTLESSAIVESSSASTPWTPSALIRCLAVNDFPSVSPISSSSEDLSPNYVDRETTFYDRANRVGAAVVSATVGGVGVVDQQQQQQQQQQSQQSQQQYIRRPSSNSYHANSGGAASSAGSGLGGLGATGSAASSAASLVNNGSGGSGLATGAGSIGSGHSGTTGPGLGDLRGRARDRMYRNNGPYTPTDRSNPVTLQRISSTSWYDNVSPTSSSRIVYGNVASAVVNTTGSGGGNSSSASSSDHMYDCSSDRRSMSDTNDAPPTCSIKSTATFAVGQQQLLQQHVKKMKSKCGSESPGNNASVLHHQAIDESLSTAHAAAAAAAAAAVIRDARHDMRAARSGSSRSQSLSPSSCRSSNSAGSTSNSHDASSSSPASGDARSATLRHHHHHHLQAGAAGTGGASSAAALSAAAAAHSSSSNPAVHSEDNRPLAICVRNLPSRSSDTSLKDGLFHEYKKHGKVTWVKVVGQHADRYALVCFKKADDVDKALEVSHDKLFFGCKIEVAPYQGYDVEDNEFRPYEAELDEYHPKSTRTLFIGNLEKDITAGELRKHFDCFGEIIEIDIKKQGVNAYAFCQYSDIISVVKAMRQMDGEHLGANRIKLGFGKSMPTNCVWIDGISDSVSESYLTAQFNRFGPVSQVASDRERKLALVFFEQIQYAQTAVKEMRGVTLRSRKLQVDFASRECQDAFYDKLEKQGGGTGGLQAVQQQQPQQLPPGTVAPATGVPPIVAIAATAVVVGTAAAATTAVAVAATFEGAGALTPQPQTVLAPTGAAATGAVPRFNRFDTPRSRTSSFSRHSTSGAASPTGLLASGCVAPAAGSGNLSGSTTPRGGGGSGGGATRRTRYAEYHDAMDMATGSASADGRRYKHYDEYSQGSGASHDGGDNDFQYSGKDRPESPVLSRLGHMLDADGTVLPAGSSTTGPVRRRSERSPPSSGAPMDEEYFSSASNTPSTSKQQRIPQSGGAGVAAAVSAIVDPIGGGGPGPGGSLAPVNPFAPPDAMRNLQKERHQILEQLEECPSSGDEIVSPKKRMRFDVTATAAAASASLGDVDALAQNNYLHHNNHHHHHPSQHQQQQQHNHHNNPISDSNCDVINNSDPNARKSVEVRRLSDCNNLSRQSSATAAAAALAAATAASLAAVTAASSAAAAAASAAHRRQSADGGGSTTSSSSSSTQQQQQRHDHHPIMMGGSSAAVMAHGSGSQSSSSQQSSTSSSSASHSSYPAHVVSKRRKTGNSISESSENHSSRGRGHQLHSHHSHEASGGESADGSRPGTPLCDERPDNLMLGGVAAGVATANSNSHGSGMPSEPRRLPHDRLYSTEPMYLPLPKFAIQMYHQQRMLNTLSGASGGGSGVSLLCASTSNATTSNYSSTLSSVLSSPPPALLTRPTNQNVVSLTSAPSFTSQAAAAAAVCSTSLNNYGLQPLSIVEQPPASPSRAPSFSSSNSSDSDVPPTSANNSPTIEERIRKLDDMFEKWSGKTTTRKHSFSDSPLGTPTSAASSTTSFRHRFTDLNLNAVPPQSDIAKTLLTRKSVFDDDLKRLENIGDKYEPRDFSNFSRSSSLLAGMGNSCGSNSSSAAHIAITPTLAAVNNVAAFHLQPVPIVVPIHATTIGSCMPAVSAAPTIPISTKVPAQLFQSPSALNQQQHQQRLNAAAAAAAAAAASPMNSPQPMSPYSSPSPSPLVVSTPPLPANATLSTTALPASSPLGQHPTTASAIAPATSSRTASLANSIPTTVGHLLPRSASPAVVLLSTSTPSAATATTPTTVVPIKGLQYPFPSHPPITSTPTPPTSAPPALPAQPPLPPLPQTAAPQPPPPEAPQQHPPAPPADEDHVVAPAKTPTNVVCKPKSHHNCVQSSANVNTPSGIAKSISVQDGARPERPHIHKSASIPGSTNTGTVKSYGVSAAAAAAKDETSGSEPSSRRGSQEQGQSSGGKFGRSNAAGKCDKTSIKNSSSQPATNTDTSGMKADGDRKKRPESSLDRRKGSGTAGLPSAHGPDSTDGSRCSVEDPGKLMPPSPASATDVHGKDKDGADPMAEATATHRFRSDDERKERKERTSRQSSRGHHDESGKSGSKRTPVEVVQPKDEPVSNVVDDGKRAGSSTMKVAIKMEPLDDEDAMDATTTPADCDMTASGTPLERQTSKDSSCNAFAVVDVSKHNKENSPNSRENSPPRVNVDEHVVLKHREPNSPNRAIVVKRRLSNPDATDSPLVEDGKRFKFADNRKVLDRREFKDPNRSSSNHRHRHHGGSKSSTTTAPTTPGSAAAASPLDKDNTSSDGERVRKEPAGGGSSYDDAQQQQRRKEQGHRMKDWDKAEHRAKFKEERANSEQSNASQSQVQAGQHGEQRTDGGGATATNRSSDEERQIKRFNKEKKLLDLAYEENRRQYDGKHPIDKMSADRSKSGIDSSANSTSEHHQQQQHGHHHHHHQQQQQHQQHHHHRHHRRSVSAGARGDGDNSSHTSSTKSSSERRSRLRKMDDSSDDSDSDEPKKHSIFDIPDEGPLYVSMYDKVKARSCKNMQKQEEEKKIKAKFSQLKRSRAKREEKKRSSQSWDEDSNSDADMGSDLEQLDDAAADAAGDAIAAATGTPEERLQRRQQELHKLRQHHRRRHHHRRHHHRRHSGGSRSRNEDGTSCNNEPHHNSSSSDDADSHAATPGGDEMRRRRQHSRAKDTFRSDSDSEPSLQNYQRMNHRTRMNELCDEDSSDQSGTLAKQVRAKISSRKNSRSATRVSAFDSSDDGESMQPSVGATATSAAGPTAAGRRSATLEKMKHEVVSSAGESTTVADSTRDSAASLESLRVPQIKVEQPDTPSSAATSSMDGAPPPPPLSKDKPVTVPKKQDKHDVLKVDIKTEPIDDSFGSFEASAAAEQSVETAAAKPAAPKSPKEGQKSSIFQELFSPESRKKHKKSKKRQKIHTDGNIDVPTTPKRADGEKVLSATAPQLTAHPVAAAAVFDELKRDAVVVVATAAATAAVVVENIPPNSDAAVAAQQQPERKRHTSRKDKKRVKSVEEHDRSREERYQLKKLKRQAKMSSASSVTDVAEQSSNAGTPTEPKPTLVIPKVAVTSTAVASGAPSVPLPSSSSSSATGCGNNPSMAAVASAKRGEKMEDIFGPLSDEDTGHSNELSASGLFSPRAVANSSTVSSKESLSPIIAPHHVMPVTPGKDWPPCWPSVDTTSKSADFSAEQTATKPAVNNKPIDVHTATSSAPNASGGKTLASSLSPAVVPKPNADPKPEKQHHREKKRDKKRKEREKPQYHGDADDNDSVDLDAAGRALEAQLMEACPETDKTEEVAVATVEPASAAVASIKSRNAAGSEAKTPASAASAKDVFRFSDGDESVDIDSRDKKHAADAERHHNRDKRKKKKRSKDEKRHHHHSTRDTVNPATSSYAPLAASATTTAPATSVQLPPPVPQRAPSPQPPPPPQHLHSTPSKSIVAPAAADVAASAKHRDLLNSSAEELSMCAVAAAKPSPSLPCLLDDSNSTPPKMTDMLRVASLARDTKLISPIPNTPTAPKPVSKLPASCEQRKEPKNLIPGFSATPDPLLDDYSNASAAVQSIAFSTPHKSMTTIEPPSVAESLISQHHAEPQHDVDPIPVPAQVQPQSLLSTSASATSAAVCLEEKSRVVISQEETEDAVAALLGESFGGGGTTDYADLFEPDPIVDEQEPVAVVPESDTGSTVIAEEEAEEMRKAVQSLNTEELDIKPETPQSDADLQIDTDTEEPASEESAIADASLSTVATSVSVVSATTDAATIAAKALPNAEKEPLTKSVITSTAATLASPQYNVMTTAAAAATTTGVVPKAAATITNAKVMPVVLSAPKLEPPVIVQSTAILTPSKPTIIVQPASNYGVKTSPSGPAGQRAIVTATGGSTATRSQPSQPLNQQPQPPIIQIPDSIKPPYYAPVLLSPRTANLSDMRQMSPKSQPGHSSSVAGASPVIMRSTVARQQHQQQQSSPTGRPQQQQQRIASPSVSDRMMPITPVLAPISSKPLQPTHVHLPQPSVAQSSHATMTASSSASRTHPTFGSVEQQPPAASDGPSSVVQFTASGKLSVPSASGGRKVGDNLPKSGGAQPLPKSVVIEPAASFRPNVSTVNMTIKSQPSTMQPQQQQQPMRSQTRVVTAGVQTPVANAQQPTGTTTAVKTSTVVVQQPTPSPQIVPVKSTAAQPLNGPTTLVGGQFNKPLDSMPLLTDPIGPTNSQPLDTVVRTTPFAAEQKKSVISMPNLFADTVAEEPKPSSVIKQKRGVVDTPLPVTVAATVVTPPKSLLTEENVIRLTETPSVSLTALVSTSSSSDAHRETEDSKEDSDYWSAKEVNIDSVIKKVDALCSGGEESEECASITSKDESSTASSSASSTNTKTPAAKIATTAAGVTAVLRPVQTPSTVASKPVADIDAPHVDDDDLDEGVTVETNKSAPAVATPSRRGRLVRGRKASPVTSGEKKTNHTSAAISAAVPNAVEPTNIVVSTPSRRSGAATPVAKTLGAAVKRGRGAGRPPVQPKHATPAVVAHPEAVASVSASVAAVAVAPESMRGKSRNTNSESDIYEFHEDSGEDTASGSAAPSAVHHQPQQQQQTPVIAKPAAPAMPTQQQQQQQHVASIVPASDDVVRPRLIVNAAATPVKNAANIVTAGAVPVVQQLQPLPAITVETVKLQSSAQPTEDTVLTVNPSYVPAPAPSASSLDYGVYYPKSAAADPIKPASIVTPQTPSEPPKTMPSPTPPSPMVGGAHSPNVSDSVGTMLLDDDFSAPNAANLRKSRRLIERDVSRSTIDDIIEDVVKNHPTSPQHLLHLQQQPQPMPQQPSPKVSQMSPAQRSASPMPPAPTSSSASSVAVAVTVSTVSMSATTVPVTVSTVTLPTASAALSSPRRSGRNNTLAPPTSVSVTCAPIATGKPIVTAADKTTTTVVQSVGDARKSPRTNRRGGTGKDRHLSETSLDGNAGEDATTTAIAAVTAVKLETAEKDPQPPIDDPRPIRLVQLESPVDAAHPPTVLQPQPQTLYQQPQQQPQHPIVATMVMPSSSSSSTASLQTAPIIALGGGKTREPLTLIDPVTGEMTVVQQSNEGHYVPVSGSLSHINITKMSIVQQQQLHQQQQQHAQQQQLIGIVGKPNVSVSHLTVTSGAAPPTTSATYTTSAMAPATTSSNDMTKLVITQPMMAQNTVISQKSATTYHPQQQQQQHHQTPTGVVTTATIVSLPSTAAGGGPMQPMQQPQQPIIVQTHGKGQRAHPLKTHVLSAQQVQQQQQQPKMMQPQQQQQPIVLTSTAPPSAGHHLQSPMQQQTQSVLVQHPVGSNVIKPGQIQVQPMTNVAPKHLQQQQQQHMTTMVTKGMQPQMPQQQHPHMTMHAMPVTALSNSAQPAAVNQTQMLMSQALHVQVGPGGRVGSPGVQQTHSPRMVHNVSGAQHVVKQQQQQPQQPLHLHKNAPSTGQHMPLTIPISQAGQTLPPQQHQQQQQLHKPPQHGPPSHTHLIIQSTSKTQAPTGSVQQPAAQFHASVVQTGVGGKLVPQPQHMTNNHLAPHKPGQQQQQQQPHLQGTPLHLLPQQQQQPQHQHQPMPIGKQQHLPVVHQQHVVVGQPPVIITKPNQQQPQQHQPPKPLHPQQHSPSAQILKIPQHPQQTQLMQQQQQQPMMHPSIQQAPSGVPVHLLNHHVQLVNQPMNKLQQQPPPAPQQMQHQQQQQQAHVIQVTSSTQQQPQPHPAQLQHGRVPAPMSTATLIPAAKLSAQPLPGQVMHQQQQQQQQPTIVVQQQHQQQQQLQKQHMQQQQQPPVHQQHVKQQLQQQQQPQHLQHQQQQPLQQSSIGQQQQQQIMTGAVASPPLKQPHLNVGQLQQQPIVAGASSSRVVTMPPTISPQGLGRAPLLTPGLPVGSFDSLQNDMIVCASGGYGGQHRTQQSPPPAHQQISPLLNSQQQQPPGDPTAFTSMSSMVRGAPVPRDHFMYHPQYLRAGQDMIGQTARSPYVQRSIVPGSADPKDLTADADERPATSPPIELRRVAAAAAAAGAGVASVAAAANAAMRSTVAVPHSLQSPQDQRATDSPQVAQVYMLGSRPMPLFDASGRQISAVRPLGGNGGGAGGSAVIVGTAEPPPAHRPVPSQAHGVYTQQPIAAPLPPSAASIALTTMPPVSSPLASAGGGVVLPTPPNVGGVSVVVSQQQQLQQPTTQQQQPQIIHAAAHPMHGQLPNSVQLQMAGALQQTQQHPQQPPPSSSSMSTHMHPNKVAIEHHREMELREQQEKEQQQLQQQQQQIHRSAVTGLPNTPILSAGSQPGSSFPIAGGRFSIAQAAAQSAAASSLAVEQLTSSAFLSSPAAAAVPTVATDLVVAPRPPGQQQQQQQRAPPPPQPPATDSLLMLLRRYPVMWQGLLALKTDHAAVQMHFVWGNPNVAAGSLPLNRDGSTPPLRIAQRMRLEQTQLEGVARKMQISKEHCMLLALPCGRDHNDVLQQSTNLQTGFITYLQQKQAAGIINLPAPDSDQVAYVAHIFPSCEFANDNLKMIAPDLLQRVADIAHLLIVIATV